MSFLTILTGTYARWQKKRFKARWDKDFEILLRQQKLDDPYNRAGLELALLHLRKIKIHEPSALQRRTMVVYSAIQTVDELLAALSLIKTIIVSRDTMPKDFSRDESKHRRFDDYFVSVDGHIVSIEKIHSSLEGRLTQLFSTLGELEVNEASEYTYYLRKLHPLYRDAYYTLQAIYATSYQ